jgi:hypothetical protein
LSDRGEFIVALLSQLLRDESGVVISSELVMLGTLGVLGMTVGLNMVATSVNEEFRDLAYGIRSLNQSYAVCGFSSCRAYTAGSSFTQRPVAESIADLCAYFPQRPVPGQGNPPVLAPPVIAPQEGPTLEKPMPEAPQTESTNPDA